MWGRARRAAASALARNVEVFERVGYRRLQGGDALTAALEPTTGGPPLVLRMAQTGRVFGGSYALEVASATPALPATRGLRARGKGVLRLSRVDFRARAGDSAGADLARRLGDDESLREALRGVHFESIRIEPEGRPVLRHLGGSVVWVLFPPLVRAVPLIEAQARASVRALEAFAAAPGTLSPPGGAGRSRQGRER